MGGHTQKDAGSGEHGSPTFTPKEGGRTLAHGSTPRCATVGRIAHGLSRKKASPSQEYPGVGGSARLGAWKPEVGERGRHRTCGAAGVEERNVGRGLAVFDKVRGPDGACVGRQDGPVARGPSIEIEHLMTGTPKKSKKKPNQKQHENWNTMSDCKLALCSTNQHMDTSHSHSTVTVTVTAQSQHSHSTVTVTVTAQSQHSHSHSHHQSESALYAHGHSTYGITPGVCGAARRCVRP